MRIKLLSLLQLMQEKNYPSCDENEIITIIII